MNPVTTCLRKVDDASALTDTTLVETMANALDELEASYDRPSERIVALEAVLQDFSRRRSSTKGTPFGRFLRISVERRQIRSSR